MHKKKRKKNTWQKEIEEAFSIINNYTQLIEERDFI